MQKPLTSTLQFQLKLDDDGTRLLNRGQLEARRVVNEIFRLDEGNYDWNQIEDIVVERSAHVKNTTQRLFDKATNALERHYDEEEYGHPRQNHVESYPIRMNHGEGYQLELDEEADEIEYRVSALKYQHVRGTLHGSQHHLDRLETALTSDDWRVGTAEVVNKSGRYELHVNVTHETAEVADKQDATTFVGVDVNEDCVGLAAVTEDAVVDSLVIEYPEVKRSDTSTSRFGSECKAQGKPPSNVRYVGVNDSLFTISYTKSHVAWWIGPSNSTIPSSSLKTSRTCENPSTTERE